MIETVQPHVPYWELSNSYHLWVYEELVNYSVGADTDIFESAGDTSDAWDMFIH